ncbi:MAG: hypothetical protein KME20_22570 [Kaiparowitsia implicata GSE-PSE-MK54-09C]|nr:hypothetical protein [Kaiparowitsia implicata GSE-PSE-MK54-09C]
MTLHPVLALPFWWKDGEAVTSRLQDGDRKPMAAIAMANYIDKLHRQTA